MNKTFTRSTKLNRVSYDIKGPILKEVRRLEAANIRVTRLNIGSPASFGLFAPENILDDVKNNITCAQAQAYCDSNGIEEARAAIVRYYNGKGVAHIGLDDVYIGNGVSELILLVMQALLNQGDEVLVPAPDYPLWTAAVNLSQGRAVHCSVTNKPTGCQTYRTSKTKSLQNQGDCTDQSQQRPVLFTQNVSNALCALLKSTS